MIDEEKYIKHLLNNYSSPFSEKVWMGVMAGVKEIEKKRRRILLKYLTSLICFISLLSYSYFALFTAIYDIDSYRAVADFEMTSDEYESQFKAQINQAVNYNPQPESVEAVDLEKNSKVSFQQSERSLNSSLLVNNTRPIYNSILTNAGSLEGNNVSIIEPSPSLNADYINLEVPEFKLLPTIEMQQLQSEQSDYIAYNNRLAKPSLFNKYANHDDPCLSNSQGNINWSADLYWSHEYGLSNVSAKDSEYNGLANMRRDTESPSYSFSAGLKINAITNSGFGFRTGLNYSQINEKFSYIDPESNQIRTITTVDYIYQNGVIIDSIVKKEEILIPGTLEIVHRNSYKLIDIPILFTIEQNIGRSNFYYSINAGVMLNLQFSQRVRMLKDDLKSVSYFGSSYGENETFKKSLNSSLFLSAGIYYRFKERIHFSVEPNLRLHSQSFTVSSHPVSQSYIHLGFSTGMRYLF